MKGKDSEPLRLTPGVTCLLDPDAAVNEMKVVLGREYDLLRAHVSKGSRILNAVASNVPASHMRDSTAALLWLYLEALDGVDVVMRAGAIGPAEIVTRSLLEDGLQLIYLLQRNDERVAAAYGVDRLRRNLAGFEKLVDGSPQKREIVTEARRTWMSNAAAWKKHPDTSQQAARMRASLQAGVFEEVGAEMDKLGPNAPWYAVYGGPGDLMQVARETGMDHWHRMLYGPMSDRVHGRASNTVWSLDPRSGDTFLKKLRDTTEWSTILVSVHFLNKRVFELAVQCFAIDLTDDLAKWASAMDQGLRECLERNGRAPEQASPD